MDIEETRLPGVGLRHELAIRGGRRVGVVSQVNGDRELVLYDQHDPDACQAVLHLTPEEASTLAELLGAPRVTERLARLREQVEGIATEGLVLAPESPYVGRTLGDAQIRTRTGVSVVAVVRHGEVSPSPAPTFRFVAGDKVIVVGTDDGVAAVHRLLADG
ncbi:cation:proton antiporter regulatory subunit [uncultured Cellulomonas sp.]|uniref:cation:proton antiporter regulatory subunit n=1 Tax=uncultured Cellulomonas sp. TaxID=189682 RepID=UPI00260D3961|nr:cation:proton antiporter regulatory subunit [uncultured Cellulomonas sp.]